MNITRENIDDLNAVLKVNIVKADYEEKMETVLKDYRKKATIKGFRPGMVPIGLVKKMYGKAVRFEEINKIVSESISKYISDEKMEVLGDPMPKADENDKIDFEKQEDFSFTFELGLAPSFEISLNKKNKLNYYEMIVDEKMRNDYIENNRRRFGEYKEVDLSAEKDLLKGTAVALDDKNNPIEGTTTENASIYVDNIKDESIKKSFFNKKVYDSVDFDLRSAFPTDNEVAALLMMKQDEASGINGTIRYTIKTISRFEPAEINKDLFDKVFGDGVVSTEEEFIQKAETEIKNNLKRESEYKLLVDSKKLALEKIEFMLPELFLKKWLLKVNEKITKEQIDSEFENFKQDLRWQLIRNKIAKENEIRITEEELLNEAANLTRYQFQQYGLFYATDEQIGNYAKEMIKREDDAKRIAEKLLDEKVGNKIKELIRINEKQVTVEDFNKLFE
jgi:trigger factor